MDKRLLYRGVNLGGWISQYPVYDHRYFKEYITASDIMRIADWGLDHVRLPFDYPILEHDDQPGIYLESGWDYIETCLAWCAANKLRVVLDMHKAPGFAFDNLKGSSMFDTPALQNRFLALWAAIASRFAGRYQDTLAYELLNEVVLPDSGPWNTVAARALETIRAVDAERLVIVGGNLYNIPEQLQYLELPHDDHLLYTFHYYKPFMVTHQLAPWIPFMVRYGKQVEYPGIVKALDPALVDPESDSPLVQLVIKAEVGVQLDRDYLHRGLQPAIEFMKQTGEPLYCGEFGVYRGASIATRLAWMRDFIGLLDEYQIGRACWIYKEADFGLVDVDGSIVNQDLIDIVAGNDKPSNKRILRSFHDDL